MKFPREFFEREYILVYRTPMNAWGSVSLGKYVFSSGADKDAQLFCGKAGYEMMFVYPLPATHFVLPY